MKENILILLIKDKQNHITYNDEFRNILSSKDGVNTLNLVGWKK